MLGWWYDDFLPLSDALFAWQIIFSPNLWSTPAVLPLLRPSPVEYYYSKLCIALPITTTFIASFHVIVSLISNEANTNIYLSLRLWKISIRTLLIYFYDEQIVKKGKIQIVRLGGQFRIFRILRIFRIFTIFSSRLIYSEIHLVMGTFYPE